jgi:hypothetical protein
MSNIARTSNGPLMTILDCAASRALEETLPEHDDQKPQPLGGFEVSARAQLAAGEHWTFVLRADELTTLARQRCSLG